jgi:hypothetical protein
VIADGTLYLLSKPGKLSDAAIVVPLSLATLERGDVEADPAGTEGLSLQTDAGSFTLSFRSEWAVRSWAKCLIRNVDRPFPGIRVHDVPANMQSRKSSLRVVPNPIFGVAAVAPLLQSPGGVVQVANPLYGNEVAEEILSPKGTRVVKIANSLFNNESLDALISPRRGRASSNDRIRRIDNPVFANGQVEGLISPRGGPRKIPNPVYRKRLSHPDSSHDLYPSAQQGASPPPSAAAKAASPVLKKYATVATVQAKSDQK